ncbi:MAG: hypothetical protein GC179_06670 [Anaerolineaceae bacterium]|nr:hypothetical protein [Anaerolineaceae bacterium]
MFFQMVTRFIRESNTMFVGAGFIPTAHINNPLANLAQNPPPALPKLLPNLPPTEGLWAFL